MQPQAPQLTSPAASAHAADLHGAFPAQLEQSRARGIRRAGKIWPAGAPIRPCRRHKRQVSVRVSRSAPVNAFKRPSVPLRRSVPPRVSRARAAAPAAAAATATAAPRASVSASSSSSESVSLEDTLLVKSNVSASGAFIPRCGRSAGHGCCDAGAAAAVAGRCRAGGEEWKTGACVRSVRP